MQIELLEKLRCPLTRQQLVLSGDVPSQVIDGMLTSEDGSQQYPIRGGIPRFVPESNYADSFGLQWNKFRKTQLDSYSGQPISADRFWNATGWNPDVMKNSWVMDAGCGAGRFAEIAPTSERPSYDGCLELTDGSHPHPFEIEWTGLLLEGWIFTSS